MMWALEYDPDLFSEYEDPDSANEGSSKAKAKIRHCGKYERENMKAKDAEAPLPIAVFLVASVLKDRSSKLLTEAQGLDDVVKNVGGHYETWNTGVLGPVALRGLDQGKWDLSWEKWTYQVGLKGEIMNLVSPDGISSVNWMQGSLIAQKQQPLTWHKAYFNAPDGDEPLALDMGSMGKGQVWINGQSIGRYWTAFATGNCNGHGEYGKRSLCLIKHKADAW